MKLRNKTLWNWACVFLTFTVIIFMSVCLLAYTCFMAVHFMCIAAAYKWAMSVSQGSIKHKLYIKAAMGCVRQDRSERSVFTVIKVNSGQSLGITLRLRLAAALFSQLYGLWPLVSNLQAPLFFKGKKRKHVKANLPAWSLLPPPSHTTSPLLVFHP